jgi:hypothetical protein
MEVLGVMFCFSHKPNMAMKFGSKLKVYNILNLRIPRAPQKTSAFWMAPLTT